MILNSVPFTKIPSDVLDYNIDWTNWLQGGDTITSVSWSVPPGLNTQSASSTTTSVTIWLTGGAVNRTYTIPVQITTAGGRKKEAAFQIQVTRN